MRINLGILLAVVGMYETIEFTDVRGETNFVYRDANGLPETGSPSSGAMFDAHNAVRFMPRNHHCRPNPRAAIPMIHRVA